MVGWIATTAFSGLAMTMEDEISGLKLLLMRVGTVPAYIQLRRGKPVLLLRQAPTIFATP